MYLYCLLIKIISILFLEMSCYKRIPFFILFLLYFLIIVLIIKLILKNSWLSFIVIKVLLLCSI